MSFAQEWTLKNSPLGISSFPVEFKFWITFYFLNNFLNFFFNTCILLYSHCRKLRNILKTIKIIHYSQLMLFMLLQKWDFPSTCLSIFYNIRISNVISNFSLLFSMSFYHEFISKDLNNLGLFLGFSVAIFFKSILMFPNYLSPPFPEEKTEIDPVTVQVCPLASLVALFQDPLPPWRSQAFVFPYHLLFCPSLKNKKKLGFPFSI